MPCLSRTSLIMTLPNFLSCVVVNVCPLRSLPPHSIIHSHMLYIYIYRQSALFPTLFVFGAFYEYHIPQAFLPRYAFKNSQLSLTDSANKWDFCFYFPWDFFVPYAPPPMVFSASFCRITFLLPPVFSSSVEIEYESKELENNIRKRREIKWADAYHTNSLNYK